MKTGVELATLGKGQWLKGDETLALLASADSFQSDGQSNHRYGEAGRTLEEFLQYQLPTEARRRYGTNGHI